MGQQKALVYSFVAQGREILAEYAELTGDFTSIAAQWLERLPTSNNKFSHNHEGYTYNFLVENGFIYCVVANASAGIELPKVFLERIKEDFYRRYGGNETTKVVSRLNKEYRQKIKEHMQYCGDHPEEISKLAAVEIQISEVKVIMNKNIEDVLNRHEKLDDLNNKTKQLQDEAGRFRKGGNELRRNMWLKNMKIKLIVLTIIIILILVIVLSVCHGFNC